MHGIGFGFQQFAEDGIFLQCRVVAELGREALGPGTVDFAESLSHEGVADAAACGSFLNPLVIEGADGGILIEAVGGGDGAWNQPAGDSTKDCTTDAVLQPATLPDAGETHDDSAQQDSQHDKVICLVGHHVADGEGHHRKDHDADHGDLLMATEKSERSAHE